jgi:hypothetical protein
VKKLVKQSRIRVEKANSTGEFMSRFGFIWSTQCAVVLLTAVMSLASQAQTLAKPVGPVILTVTGEIKHKNSANAAEFDAAMIDMLADSQIKTTTPWRKGVVTFAGPTLKSLLALVGAKGKTLRMTALDKYEVRVPFQDADQFNPILARKIDGVMLKVRDHGPFFMVYPFDDMPALKNDLYYGRSIWHLTSIVVE